MKKVFLSSTFLDLKPHRKRIVKLLEELEVNTLGMEGFGARTAKPLETCIKEVLDADIYLGIIAVRYGSVDPTTGKSFTQLEYDAAYEAGKQVLIYLLDDHAGTVPPKFIDFENHDKLTAFIKVLKERHTVDTFKNPADLCKKLRVNLTSLQRNPTKIRFRPEIINCTVTRILVSDQRWLIFVGFTSGKPHEIFMGKASDFYMPDYVRHGAIRNRNPKYQGEDIVITDFCYEDNYGYEVTHRGLSRTFDKSCEAASNVINTLLANDTPLETILQIIPSLEFSTMLDKDAMKTGIQKALTETNINFDDFLISRSP